ncbi:MAG TPA: FtsQ-type POTRA domain-containing protein [Solirubrobacteraceae bacterium]|nr:FtsQ-type POTRA domain-containing protein [Solirubrobacteraceae bacterium]
MELSLPLRLPRRASSSRPRRPGSSQKGLDGFAGLALDALRARRLALRVSICAALALPLLGGGWLWLRNSSLVAIEHVHIAGVHGGQSIEIRDALDSAARRMSALHMNTAALRAAVASYPEVAGLSASTGFPHTLSIRVQERQPVATLVGPGERTAIAADGTVLGPALVSASLPTVAAKTAPAPGAHLGESAALGAAVALGAAPARLLGYVERAYEGAEGLTLQMRNGLLVYFGDDSRPHAKWLSLARVLASPDTAGATYVDVRLPARPAAGFSQPGSAIGSPASTLTPAQVGTSDPAAAKLAEQLSQEVGGSSSPSSTTGESESHEEERSSQATEEAPPTG